MADARLSIRIDLPNGDRIGPGKIELLEAIRSTGPISAGARALGMSYRRAWLLVEEINNTLRQPAVSAAIGGASGGGAMVTPVGEEPQARDVVGEEFRAIGQLVRTEKRRG
jgi:molybdate transport system regulatory protein